VVSAGSGGDHSGNTSGGGLFFGVIVNESGERAVVEKKTKHFFEKYM